MKVVFILTLHIFFFSCSTIKDKKINKISRGISSVKHDLTDCFSAFSMLVNSSNKNLFSKKMTSVIVGTSQDDITITYSKPKSGENYIRENGNLDIGKLERNESAEDVLVIQVSDPLKERIVKQKDFLPKENEGKRFYLQTISTSNDGEYRSIIDEAISKRFNPYLHKEVEIIINGSLRNQIKMSQDVVSAQHDRVVDFYKSKKGDYLQAEDYKQLSTLDDNYNNQFAVSITTRSYDNNIREYYDSLKATITLVMPNKDVFGPSFSFFSHPQRVRIPLMDRMYYISPEKNLNNFDNYFLRSDNQFVGDNVIERARNSIANEIDNYKPGEGDISTAFSLEQHIYKVFGKEKKFAELVRYSHFEQVTSQERSILLYEAFKKAKEAKIDYIFASTDRDTRVLFKRKYKMKELGKFYSRKFHEVAEEEEIMEEFILFLDVGSELFDRILNDLKNEI